jgi:hypothetical protein
MAFFSSKEEAINFRSSNWFEQYLAFRLEHPASLDIPDPAQFGLSEEQVREVPILQNPLYAMLLHSGIVYGFPFLSPFKPVPPGDYEDRWRTKLILLDTILFSTIEDLKQRDGARSHYPEQLEEAGNLIRAYYRGILSAHAGEEVFSIEQQLAHRVMFHRNWLDWRRTGINAHLFWDWFFFQLYMREAVRGRGADFDFEALVAEKKAMKWLSMQLIAAAAHSDRKVKRREGILAHHFQKSAQFFSQGERDRLGRMFEKGIRLDELHFPETEWMAKRYWLDLSLLVIYADKDIHEAEEGFLHQLMHRLGLPESELTESKLALGGFLLRFGRKMPFISGRKSSLALIGQALAQNFSKMQKATHAEYKETLDMAVTLGRLLQHQVGLGKGKSLPSEEEIRAAFNQIKDLPKFLPFITIRVVPVPGITELYLLLAYSIERLSGDSLRLLPSHFSKMVKGEKDPEEESDQ